jgi:hypothetical protein
VLLSLLPTLVRTRRPRASSLWQRERRGILLLLPPAGNTTRSDGTTLRWWRGALDWMPHAFAPRVGSRTAAWSSRQRQRVVRTRVARTSSGTCLPDDSVESMELVVERPSIFMQPWRAEKLIRWQRPMSSGVATCIRLPPPLLSPSSIARIGRTSPSSNDRLVAGTLSCSSPCHPSVEEETVEGAARRSSPAPPERSGH